MKTKLYIVTTIEDHGYGNEVHPRIFKNMGPALQYFKEAVKDNFLKDCEDINYYCDEEEWETAGFYQIGNSDGEMFTADFSVMKTMSL